MTPIKQALTFSSLFLASCAPSPVFVVMRDVPVNPSFVVIPITDYRYEVEYANEIEAFLLTCGLKVIDRPIQKSVESKQTNSEGAGKLSNNSDAITADGAVGGYERVEKYYALGSTKADYILQTNANRQSIKVIKKDTEEVLASFYVYSVNTQTESTLKTAMVNLGLSVRPTCGDRS